MHAGIDKRNVMSMYELESELTRMVATLDALAIEFDWKIQSSHSRRFIDLSWKKNVTQCFTQILQWIISMLTAYISSYSFFRLSHSSQTLTCLLFFPSYTVLLCFRTANALKGFSHRNTCPIIRSFANAMDNVQQRVSRLMRMQHYFEQQQQEILRFIYFLFVQCTRMLRRCRIDYRI